MRSIVLLFFSLPCMMVQSQSLIDCNSLESCAEVIFEVDDATGQCFFQEVVDAPGRSASELHQQSRLWFAETFKSSQDVIQLDDSEAHIIIGKAWSPLQDRGDRIWYTFKVECKDGRYRYTMYDVEYDSGQGSSFTYREFLCHTLIEKRIKKGRRAKTDLKYRYAYIQAINNLTDSLKESMASRRESDDW